MKKAFLYSVFILIAYLGPLSGQESISADISQGCDSLTVQFTLNTSLQLSDYNSVEWRFGDASSASAVLNPLHTYITPGSYNVSCLLDADKTITLPEPIVVSSSPYADFVFKDSSASKDEYVFYFGAKYYTPRPGELLSYEWYFEHDGTTALDSTTLHSFPEEGIYLVSLKVENDAGCMDSITRKIPVSHELMPPNVFSPNGDMINDYFEVTTHGEYIYTFRVFTRTGTLVHYSTSRQIRWDGRTTGGLQVPEGVYYYVIESQQTPSETKLTGFVHLYR